MAEDARVAKRYAEALFNTARERDVIASVEDDLKAIAGLLENDPSFRDFLLSPNHSHEDKVAISERLFADRVTALTMSLIRLLLHKRRETEIIGIRDEFETLRRGHAKAVFVTITSAEALPNDQRKELIERMAKLTDRKVEAEFVVEPALLGGVKLEYENSVVDGTVHGNLRKLRTRLHRDLFQSA